MEEKRLEIKKANSLYSEPYKDDLYVEIYLSDWKEVLDNIPKKEIEKYVEKKRDK